NWTRPDTRRPLTNVPLRDNPLSTTVHAPATRSSVECSRETNRSPSMTTSAVGAPPIVTTPPCSSQRRCSPCTLQRDRSGGRSGSRPLLAGALVSPDGSAMPPPTPRPHCAPPTPSRQPQGGHIQHLGWLPSGTSLRDRPHKAPREYRTRAAEG